MSKTSVLFDSDLICETSPGAGGVCWMSKLTFFLNPNLLRKYK